MKSHGKKFISLCKAIINRKGGRARPGIQAGELLFQYLLSLLAFIVITCIIGLMAFIVCKSRIWYSTDPWYQILKTVSNNLLLFYGIIWFAGALALLYYFLSKTLHYLDAVIHASEKLAHLSEEPIVLPDAMRSVEDELNLVREQALRNDMLAKKAEQRKNDLIVYLAHDLKTPLTSVIGYLNLLLDEPQISEGLRSRYTGIALDKAQRLEDLINEFFDITRFNLTALVLEPEWINLSRMLEQITSEFEPILAEKGLWWNARITPDIQLMCDPDKIQRVFDNLIRNAVNYSYADTEVTLAMEPVESAVKICVQNHARTIPPEKLSHIFEQFYRVDASRTATTGGAGLGLAIAKEIVELHGGSIAAESKKDSILFTVLLPL